MFGRTILLLGLLFSASVFAEPRQWDTNGLPVDAAFSVNDYAQATRADGSTLVVWAESFEAEPVVMGQLLSPAGEPMWEDGGRMIARGLYKAGFPTVTAVSGGWVVVWLDAEILAWCDRLDGGWCISAKLRAVKVNDAGTPIWASGIQGVAINPENMWFEPSTYSVFESGGGCIVQWTDFSELYARRVNQQGELEWPDDLFIDGSYYGSSSALASDGTGGLIWTWSYIANGDTFLRANRVTPDGVPMWNGRDGLIVRTSNVNFNDVALAADGTGGAFVLWKTSEASSPHYALRVSGQGDLVWDNPVALSEARADQRILSLATSIDSESPDGLLILFTRSLPNNEAHSQKIMLNGDLPWGTIGESICISPDNSQYFEHGTIQTDNHGGLIAFYSNYQDWPVYGNFLTVSRVNSDGTKPWGNDCGTVVDTATYFSYWSGIFAPSLSEDGLQVTWFETDSYVSSIKTQRVNWATGENVYASPRVLLISDEHTPWSSTIVALSNGSTATAWNTSVQGRNAVFFQIQDVFGERQLDHNGISVCVNPDGTPVPGTNPSLCPDGSGGFFAVMKVDDQSSSYILRVAHVNSMGERIGNPAGVTLFQTPTYSDFESASCVADGQGGCYIAASLYDANFMLVSVTMRVNANCEPVWQNPVVVVDPQREVMPRRVFSSNDGSCIVVYIDRLWPNTNVKAVRIQPDGTIRWTSLLHRNAVPDFRFGSVQTDHSGGAIVVWQSNNSEQSRNMILAQRVNASGDPMWGVDGVTIGETNWPLESMSMDVDPVGNATIAWSIYDNEGNSDVFAQRVSHSGELMWGDSGLVICDEPLGQYNPSVVSISDNEVYIFWEDHREAAENFWWPADIYATHLDARGRIGGDSYWQENGSVVCDYLHVQTVPQAINDGMGGATLIFRDQRGNFDWDFAVFSQRLFDPIFTDAEEKPELPTEFSLSQNYPNPFNPETVIEFTLPTEGKATLRVFDVTGREVATLVNGALAAGNHRVNFDATELSSGVYFYTLNTGNSTLTRKMVLLR